MENIIDDFRMKENITTYSVKNLITSKEQT